MHWSLTHDNFCACLGFHFLEMLFPRGKESREIKDVCHQKNPARRLPPDHHPGLPQGSVSLSLAPPRLEVPRLCLVPETVFLHGCGNKSVCHIYSSLSHFLELIKVLSWTRSIVRTEHIKHIKQNHCSDSMNLLIRDSSCKWNHTVFVLLWLGLFHLAIFKVYLCCNLC